MKLTLWFLLVVTTVMAQDAPPQTVAFIESPNNAAFSSMTPKPDFPGIAVFKLRVTAPGVVKVTIQGEGATTKPITTYVDLYLPEGMTTYWQTVMITLPDGFVVLGTQVQLMAAVGSPIAVPAVK